MRYPEGQAEFDKNGPAILRPGDKVVVQGILKRMAGVEETGTVLLSRKTHKAEAVFVATKNYGRRWFFTRGNSFRARKM